MLNKLIVACRNNDAKGGEVSLNANYADIEIKEWEKTKLKWKQ